MSENKKETQRLSHGQFALMMGALTVFGTIFNTLDPSEEVANYMGTSSFPMRDAVFFALPKAMIYGFCATVGIDAARGYGDDVFDVRSTACILGGITVGAMAGKLVQNILLESVKKHQHEQRAEAAPTSMLQTHAQIMESVNDMTTNDQPNTVAWHQAAKLAL